MTTPLEAAAEEWIEHRELHLYCSDDLPFVYDEAFIAGARWDRARILSILRSKEGMGAELDLGLSCGDFEIMADWLEGQLKK